MSARCEDLRRELDGLGEVTRDFRQCGDEEVAEAVSFEAGVAGLAGRKAMPKQPREQVLIVGQGHHAVAQVAGRQHVEVFAQAAAGTAIVGPR